MSVECRGRSNDDPFQNNQNKSGRTPLKVSVAHLAPTVKLHLSRWFYPFFPGLNNFWKKKGKRRKKLIEFVSCSKSSFRSLLCWDCRFCVGPNQKVVTQNQRGGRRTNVTVVVVFSYSSSSFCYHMKAIKRKQCCYSANPIIVRFLFVFYIFSQAKGRAARLRMKNKIKFWFFSPFVSLFVLRVLLER